MSKIVRALTSLILALADGAFVMIAANHVGADWGYWGSVLVAAAVQGCVNSALIVRDMS